MHEAVIYFALKNPIYVAWFDDSLIILDSDADSYLSLVDDAAHYFAIIIEQAFIQNADGAYRALVDSYDHETLNFWIHHFLERQFIVSGSTKNKRSIARPLQDGGLCNYQWDTKPSWQPFKQVSKWQIGKALILLIRVHWIMKRSGIKGLLELIDVYAKQVDPLRQPTELEITTIAAAVDAASILYPKKTFCLAWSATYVCLSLKRGLEAQLVIGVQKNPFYAHAWAEANQKVVHDDPAIAKVLSVILKTPSQQSI